MRRLSIPVLFVLLVSAMPSVEAGGADWNQWRGPTRDGKSVGPAWPDSLRGLQPRWQVPLGLGYPGPIVTADRVFVVETRDKGTVAARALDRSSGEEIWNVSWPAGGSVPFFAASNGDWVRSTPAFDGERLYVGDMMEVLRALDGKTGATLWTVDFPASLGTGVPDFGFASSPLIDGDHLFVQAANSLLKIEARTGEILWRSLEGSAKIASNGAFSSPVMATIGDRRQLVVLTREGLFGVDPASGSTLWERPVESFRGMNILTPIVHEDGVFTSPYRNGSHFFVIGAAEGENPPQVEERWSIPSSGYMSTPVVVGGHAYLLLGNRRLECIDLETGAPRWRTEQRFGRYWSMIVRGDRILALDEDGTLYLFRANPEKFELLDSRKITENEAWAHLASSGDQVFVRDVGGILAFDWPVASSTPAAEDVP